jgi:riboflavin kinase/FMN adenylyltransferase
MLPTLAPHGARSGGAWVTIGSFDGVHVGHQHIIRSLVEQARRANSPAVAVTFFPHPQKVLRNLEEPFYLSTPEEKDELMSNLGVDSVLTIHFDLSFSKTSAADFMRCLHNQLAFSRLMIGQDFTLGANREGNFSMLEQIGQKLGYQVAAIEPVRIESRTISSSGIRDLLNAGKIAEANRNLGHPYQLSGSVIHGDGRGKHIGIPTANLAVWEEKLVPAVGVYAALAEVDGRTHASVANIGHRPTFYENPAEKSIEVHLLEFNREIYGQRMRLNLVERIRPEIKFSSAQELMDQIHQDISQTKEILAHAAD